jgi:acetyltransferase-like isoleucine patch superfamily enzyme
MPKLTLILTICAVPLPWSIRRFLFRSLCGFKIDKSAYISRWSLVMPSHLEMGPHSYIGHFTTCKGMDLIRLEECARIGALNWITAFPLGTTSEHFQLDSGRQPQLIVERHAAITNRHLIDCTDEVVVGAFSTVAGFRSQILTHSIDLKESRQRCKPVHIGRYTFVGTACVFLGGSSLPDRSVLGAHSLLIEKLLTPGYLYGGVPAKPIKPIDPESRYFSRDSGYVF